MSPIPFKYIFTFDIRYVTQRTQAGFIVRWGHDLRASQLISVINMETDAFLELLEKFQDQEPFSAIAESSDINALKGLAGLASGEMREHIFQEIERIPKALEAKKALASEGERS